jgi:hypothetical protein
MHPEHRSIGVLAYHLWQARGCPEGSAEQDWLDAEKQLRSASDVLDSSLQETIPASDPPASHRPDEPPTNADAKWNAAGTSRTRSADRPRRSKSTQGKRSAQGKPSAEPPS